MEKVPWKKMQVVEKVGNSRNIEFLQWFVASEGRKVGSLKRRVQRHLARMRNEKLHAVVVWSTFWSEKCQNTPCSEHFWKLRCGKIACCCGTKHIGSKKCQSTSGARHCCAKHIWKSKCTKHLSFRPLLEVAMLKKCTPLWPEAHLEVNMYKTHHSRTTFGSCNGKKVHAAVARSTCWIKCLNHHMFVLNVAITCRKGETSCFHFLSTVGT